MSTAVWLSTAVVNISLPVAGIVELRRMIFDTTPPIVSMPSDSGVTSSSSISRLPVTRMSACTAAPEQLFDLAAHERNARRAADQDDLVDLRRLEAGISQRLAARAEGAFDDRRNQRLELAARDSLAVHRGLVAFR